jgi:hypothetical protein
LVWGSNQFGVLQNELNLKNYLVEISNVYTVSLYQISYNTNYDLFLYKVNDDKNEILLRYYRF